MADNLDEQQSAGLDPKRILDIFKRHQIHFIIPFFFGWLVVWCSSWFLAPRYKSNTTILVEQPTMPQDYVVPNITDDLQARMQSITQQILSRTRLLVIINKLNLYHGNGATDEQKIAQMRDDISIDLVRNQGGTNISAFTIAYSSGDPQLAQQVTAQLTELFINENLKVRQELSQGTTDFLQKQMEDARQRLEEQEAKVRAFENQHGGSLPTEEESNLQILSGLESQLQSEQDALNTAKQHRAYSEATLQQERAAEANARQTDSQTGEPVSANLAALNSQLDKLRADLADLSSRYTDKYPDVLRLKTQIARTEAMRDNLMAAQEKAKANPEKQTTSASTDMTLSTTVRQLQGQVQADQVEIQNRENAVKGLTERIGEYQSRLNLTPGTSQELADLTRGYDQSKANYDDLLKKRDESQVATSMEQMQQGERFTILDPPSLPSKPDFPNRVKFCGLGLGAGLFLGALVVASFELKDDRLYRDQDIKALLPVSVISEIPAMVSRDDEMQTKRSANLRWVATVAALLIILSCAAFSYIRG